jgi:lipooligosaccharide transport system permease protein
MPASETLRVVEYHVQANRPWLRSSIVQSIVSPVLFLAAMGLGLGSLIKQDVAGASYLAFVGSGLMAATAMQVGASDSMFPVMGGIKWLRTFHAVVATPIDVHALVLGKLVWTAVRLAAGSAIYLAVLTAFGAVDRPTAVLAVPAATLCGLAFAAPTAAFSATQQNDQGFMLLLRCVVTPLFLFSGTFFPISQLPPALESFARFTPLWHGVELSRGAILGGLGARAALGHVAYLAVWVVAGWLVARGTFRRRLVT